MAPPIEIGNSTFFRKKVTKNTIFANIIQVSLILIGLILSLQLPDELLVPSIISRPLRATKTFVFFTSLFNVLLHVCVSVCFGYEGNDGDSQRSGQRHRGVLQFCSAKLKQILTVGVILLIATIVVHFTAVLFGAPLTVGVSETYHLSMMLTATTVLPACLTLGTNLEDWLKVFVQNKPGNIFERQLLITVWCSIIGAWLGVFPIPLDWDRPWQEWPISCVLGTLFGYITGLMISSFYLAWLQSKQKAKSF